MATLAHSPKVSGGWVEREALRPSCLGSPRRQPKGASCAQAPRRQSRSLDTCKELNLATSSSRSRQAAEITADEIENKIQQEENKRRNQAILIGSMERIIRSIEVKISDLEEGGLSKLSELRAERTHLKRRRAEHDRLSSCQSQWICFH